MPLSKAARERRERLAAQESPEFRAWIEAYWKELDAQPSLDEQLSRLVHTQGLPSVCISDEQRSDLKPSKGSAFHFSKQTQR
jgi:hypothetical protein